MIRKQLYITEEEEEALKKYARQNHITQASILREALNQYFTKTPSNVSNPLDGLIGGLHGFSDGSINHDHYIYGVPKKYP